MKKAERKGAGKKETGKKPRYRWAPPTSLAIALVIVATAALFFVLARDRDWRWFPTLIQREEVRGSVSTLEEIRDLGQLETLAYVRRTVFPHDFYQPHRTVTELLRTVAAADAHPADALSAKDLAHLRAANLSASLQLGTTRDDDRFTVITTIIIFGYDLFQLAEELQSAFADTPEGQRVVYTLPPPQVLDILTENITRESYPFPAVYLDADGWRQITSFVEEHVMITAPTDDLLRAAAKNSLDSLRMILDPEQMRLDILPPNTVSR